MVSLLLTRWRTGLGLFAGLALLGALLAANHYRHRAIAIGKAFDAHIAADIVNAKQAETAQAAVNHVPAILSKVIAEKSNDQAPAYYDAVHVAAERMRKDGPRCPVPASVPGTDSAAEVIHGPDPAADMVSRPRAEDDLIVNAAGRAAQMRADASQLIAAGVARLSDDIGGE